MDEKSAITFTPEAGNYLIVVDMQNDFISGSLGTDEAKLIIGPVIKKLRAWSGNIIFTMDTHGKDYLETGEGRMLPVEHCIVGTHGWQLHQELLPIKEDRGLAVYQKSTFGSVQMARDLAAINEKSPISQIELIGLCTDICVISNALLLKAYMPDVAICVDASCCAGVTPEKHQAALSVMESCLINVKR